jgi:hypothetical protein
VVQYYTKLHEGVLTKLKRHMGVWLTIAVELQASTTWTRSAVVAEEQVKTFWLNLLDGEESRLVLAIPKLDKFATPDIMKKIDEAKATYDAMEKKMASGTPPVDEDEEDDNNLDELFVRLLNNEEDHAEAMDLDESDGEVTANPDDHASTSFSRHEQKTDTEDDSPLGNMMYGHDWLIQEGLLVQQGEDVTTFEYMLRCKETWEELKMTVAACQIEITRLKKPVTVVDGDDETLDDDDDDDGDIVFVGALALTNQVAALSVESEEKSGTSCKC